MRKYKINVKVGRRIRQLRKLHKMTQEDLSSKANLHPTTLGRIERGESNPPVQTVNNIAKALKVSVSELFSQK